MNEVCDWTDCEVHGHWEVVRPGRWEAKRKVACDEHLARLARVVSDGMTLMLKELPRP